MEKTSWKLFTSNEETLDAMILACESATETIELEQFIFVPDNFGNRLINVCERKASQGVKVRFIWDAAGSFSFFGASIIEDLNKKGIELVFFKTLFPTFFETPNYRSWYFRNHRRTLVVDGKIGFTGSICIWEKSKNWRDTNIMIEGLVVTDMYRAFERMWDRAQGKKLPKIKKNRSSDHEFKYISNNPRPGHRRLYNHVVEAIRNSKKSINITTPYFVPTHRLSRVLKLAAHRGVDVKIIMPEWSDHSFVDLSARTFFYSMLKSGIKIYLYKGNMLHAKTIIIDGDWSSIGTLNMDHISLLYNFEANLITTNKKFADELSSHFNTDLLNAENITFEQWRSRYWVEKIAGFFIKFIRSFF
jgi:cardiolipin synthase